MIPRTPCETPSPSYNTSHMDVSPIWLGRSAVCNHSVRSTASGSHNNTRMLVLYCTERISFLHPLLCRRDMTPTLVFRTNSNPFLQVLGFSSTCWPNNMKLNSVPAVCLTLIPLLLVKLHAFVLDLILSLSLALYVCVCVYFYIERLVYWFSLLGHYKFSARW